MTEKKTLTECSGQVVKTGRDSSSTRGKENYIFFVVDQRIHLEINDS